MAAIDELISTYLTACEVEGKTQNTVTRKLCWSCGGRVVEPGHNAAGERTCQHCGASIDYPRVTG